MTNHCNSLSNNGLQPTTTPVDDEAVAAEAAAFDGPRE